MRKGYDGLYAMVWGYLKEDPLSGHLFVFSNRNRSRIKILCWDGSGLWLCSKRLEKGRFSWPETPGADGKIALSSTEFAMLTGGIDLTRSRRKAWWRKNEKKFTKYLACLSALMVGLPPSWNPHSSTKSPNTCVQK